MKLTKTDYYSQIAPGYDKLHKEEQLKKLNIILDELNITKKDSVLDVGCGTAFSFDYLAAIGCRFEGVEPSEGLIAQSKYKDKITQISAEKMEFPKNKFTVVISLTALQNFTDPEKGLMNIKKICSDRLAISYLKRSSKAELLATLIEKIFPNNKKIEEEKDMIHFCKL